MIDYETFVRVRNMITQEGLKPSQVSDVLGIDKRTVSKWADK